MSQVNSLPATDRTQYAPGLHTGSPGGFVYYPFVRKALFQLDPERAHEVTFQQLRRIIGTPLEMLVHQRVPTRPITYMELTFENPLSLVVGLDKSEGCINALGMMSFGSIEVGTITLRPQPDSDKPRISRLVDAKGLINRMSFNNRDVGNLVEDVKKAYFDSMLGINIDKNKDTPVEHGKDDYLICMEKAYPYAGYITIDISSPNTPGLRTLQYGEAPDDLLSDIKDKQLELQQKHQEYVPVIVKITPDLLPEELIRVADNLVRHNIDGVITTNTTLNRFLVQRMKHCDGTGRLSGRPLQLENIEIIRMLSAGLNDRLPIIGVGGIDSVIAAREKMTAGALLVQVYSGFILRGPPLVEEIVTHI